MMERCVVLVDVVNAVVGFPEGRRTREVTIKNPFVAKDYAEGKVPILDVRASDDPGRQFLLGRLRRKPLLARLPSAQ